MVLSFLTLSHVELAKVDEVVHCLLLGWRFGAIDDVAGKPAQGVVSGCVIRLDFSYYVGCVRSRWARLETVKIVIQGHLLPMEFSRSLKYINGKQLHVSPVFFFIARAYVLNQIHDVVHQMLACFITFITAPLINQ